MFGDSHIRVGNDPSEFSTSNQIVYENIYGGGSFQLSLDPIVQGQFINIRRSESIPQGTRNVGNTYAVGPLRVYQIPNLFQVNGISVLISKDTTAAFSSDYVANNLIQNLGNRSPGNDKNALTSSVPSMTLS